MQVLRFAGYGGLFHGPMSFRNGSIESNLNVFRQTRHERGQCRWFWECRRAYTISLGAGLQSERYDTANVDPDDVSVVAPMFR